MSRLFKRELFTKNAHPGTILILYKLISRRCFFLCVSYVFFLFVCWSPESAIYFAQPTAQSGLAILWGGTTHPRGKSAVPA